MRAVYERPTASRSCVTAERNINQGYRIAAVVQPAASKALYFVAKGDGSSQFSDTLDAHNRAVAKYQLGR